MKYYLASFFLLINLQAPLLLGCEGCKMSVVSGFSEPQTVMAGVALSWSVLFMLLVVFILLGVLGWALRSACLQTEALQTQGGKV